MSTMTQKMSEAGEGNVVVDAGVLGRVNVTRVKGGGDIRLLRRADPPEWPAAFQDPALTADRRRVEEALAEARKHARSGKVPAEVVLPVVAIAYAVWPLYAALVIREALIARPVFYELVEMAQERDGRLGVASNGAWFDLGAAA